MLLTKDFRVQIGDNPSPSAFPRGPIKLASWGLDPPTSAGGNDEDCRMLVAAADLRMRIGGGPGGEIMGRIGGFSHDSEHDLAVMVSDFLEIGSTGAESWYSSDSECGFSDLNHLAERILLYKHTVEQYESDLLSVVQSLILSINERDLQVVSDGQCNASCIRQSLVKLLRLSGYDAAVCSSRWQGDEKVPGGEHEYIDVVVNEKNGVSERLIIDIDFRSHFEIARAVESYEAILYSLPVVYVGSLERLKQFLQVMVEATRCSLKQNSMPLPPWRSLPYLQAKWLSSYEREPNPDEGDTDDNSSFDHSQCTGHLRRLKSSLWPEIDTERFLKPITSEKKWRANFDRRQRPSLLRS